jgi:hypothetical protein
VVKRLVAIAALATSCGDIAPYTCNTNEDCTDNGRAGTCVMDYGVCAFPDPTCDPSKLRYDQSARKLAGVCVGDETTDP